VKTKRLVIIALLTAMALIMFVVEMQLPALVPIPGVKLGLANIITLIALVLIGKRDAGIVLFLRVMLGALFAGSPSTLIFSAAGGILAYLVMCVMVNPHVQCPLWFVSACSAIAHNAGQLGMSILIVHTPGLLVYAPALVVSGVITGVFTGLAATYTVKVLKHIPFD
jgi:heptaprenyl diphosphate synthase